MIEWYVIRFNYKKAHIKKSAGDEDKRNAENVGNTHGQMTFYKSLNLINRRKRRTFFKRAFIFGKCHFRRLLRREFYFSQRRGRVQVSAPRASTALGAPPPIAWSDAMTTGLPTEFARIARQTSFGRAAWRTCRAPPRLDVLPRFATQVGCAIFFAALSRKSVKHGSACGPEDDAGAWRRRTQRFVEKFHPFRESGRTPVAHNSDRG